MSGPAEGNGHSEDSGSVLANLPRTRPQRSSARRDATRERGNADGAARSNGAAAPPAERGAKAAAKKPAKPRTAAKTQPKAARASAAKPARAGAATGARKRPKAAAAHAARRPPVEEVPRQGFESDYDRATGAVPPPDTADFLSTAVEALGELAKAGISGSERVLRDVFSRLGR